MTTTIFFALAIFAMTHINAFKSYLISFDNTYWRVIFDHTDSFQVPQTSIGGNFRSDIVWRGIQCYVFCKRLLLYLITLIEMKRIKSYFVNRALDEIRTSKLFSTRLKVRIHCNAPADSKLHNAINNHNNKFIWTVKLP